MERCLCRDCELNGRCRMKRVTDLDVLEAIDRLTKEKAWSPTVMEVALEVGKSLSVAYQHINSLEASGHITNAHKPRTILITDKGREALDGRTA